MRKFRSLRIVFFICLSGISIAQCFSQETRSIKSLNYKNKVSKHISEIISSITVIRIYAVNTAKLDSYSLLEFSEERGLWNTTISTTENVDTFNSHNVQIHPFYGYDSLFKALASNNFFNLEGDSNKYQSIILGTKNGYTIPFILPEDGVQYNIEIWRRNQVLQRYSYYAPETIANTFQQCGIQDLELFKFVEILRIIRNHFSITF